MLPNSFIRNIVSELFYKPQKSIKKTRNIVVSLTTIPSRVNSLYSTLNSLILQSKLPDQIYIGIPKISTRESIPYVIPDKIKNHPLITIIDLEKDYGPISKLITGLLSAESQFITVDDDTIYSYDLIEKLCLHSKPNTVIATIGRNEKKKKIMGKTNEKIRTIEGYGGVLYDKSYFDIKTIGELIVDEKTKYNDDIMISYFLKRENIEIKLIDLVTKEPMAGVFMTQYTNPLWAMNESHDNYEIVSNQLKVF